MKRIYLMVVLSSLVFLLVTNSAFALGLVSTFDTGSEGWTVDSSQGTSGVSNFMWNATDGNPGVSAA